VTNAPDKRAAAEVAASENDHAQEHLGSDQPVQPRQLLKEATKKAGDDPDLALALLEDYVDAALTLGPIDDVLDSAAVAQRIAHSFRSSFATREAAREFLKSTARRLALWPELAQRYEQLVLEGELDELPRGRPLPVFFYLPSVLTVFAGLVLLIVSWIQRVPPGVRLAGAIAVPGGLFLGAVLYALQRSREAQLRAEEENVRRKLNLRKLPSSTSPQTVPQTAPPTMRGRETPGGEYFENLVRINVDNLSDYYTQVRVHTNNSFWASVVAGGLGFVLIAAGLTWGFASGNARAISYVATGSGVIVEFISGAFFYLYNRTVRQLKGYHDSLLDVQNILLSFRIVEQSAPEHQGESLSRILRFLLQQKTRDTTRSPQPEA